MNRHRFKPTLQPVAARRLARSVALVALLCAALFQVQEAGHWHQPGDGASHCVVCKSPGGTALPADTLVSALPALAPLVVVVACGASNRPPAAFFHPRAPPIRS